MVLPARATRVPEGKPTVHACTRQRRSGAYIGDDNVSDEVTAIVLAVLAAIVPIAGFLSTRFKSVGTVMKIIDLFAFNWGKARNDPEAQ